MDLFSSKEDCKIPLIIESHEKLVRILFSPNNVSADGKKIRASAFRSPSTMDEVSVNRLDYCTAQICKDQGLKMQSPEDKRSYFGFGVIGTEEVFNAKASVVYTPKIDNDFHADIKIGFVCQKGQELPAEFQLKVQEMAKVARLYKDPNPNIGTWNGSQLL